MAFEPSAPRAVSLRIAAFALLSILLPGCTGANSLSVTSFGDDQGMIKATVKPDGLPHDRLIGDGKTYYLARDFGNAQVVYQKAVEVYPKNPEAWLGLAATYDQLRRFDQANIAYGKVHGLVGESSAYYNNVGYHFLLRGQAGEASRQFRRALQINPGNVVAQNNLELIRKLVQERQLSHG